MKKYITVIAILAVAGLLVWAKFIKTGPTAPAENPPTAETTPPEAPAPAATAPSATEQPSAPSPAPVQKPSPAATTIKIISPAANVQWVLGADNSIKWSAESGENGAIYLVNEATRKTEGWILSSAGPHQTSYVWDTRQIYLERYSGLKKDITPGQYSIHMKFDGRQPEIATAVFGIIPTTAVQTISRAIAIKNYAFSPAAMNVKSGDLVVFTNNDSVLHRVVSSKFGPYTLNPGETVTLNTAILSPGTYPYYCDIHPAMQASITVAQ